MNEAAISAVQRWTDPERRPLFKSKLISEDGCCCAQGDILRHECGMSDPKIMIMSQFKADTEVAKALDIPLCQSVLLRMVNDQKDGCPQDVLRNPERFFGPNHAIALAFCRYIDDMKEGEQDSIDKKIYCIPQNVMHRRHNLVVDLSPDKATLQLATSCIRCNYSLYEWASYALAEIIVSGQIDTKLELYFLPFFGFNSIEEIPVPPSA